jgi:hypothetical protein
MALHFFEEVGMVNASRVLAAVVVPIALGSFDAQAVTVDLTAGAAGTTFLNQSFNETRAADVKVLSPLDLSIANMTLREFNVGPGASGTLGARIYDSVSGALLSSGSAAVAAGANQSLTVLVTATLATGHTYRVGFFLDVGGSAGSGDFIDVNPPGLPITAYDENAGLFQITGTFQGLADSFPTNTNFGLPFISLQVAAVPEATGWVSIAIGLLILVMLARKRNLSVGSD